jgi:hypothetical protein
MSFNFVFFNDDETNEERVTNQKDWIDILDDSAKNCTENIQLIASPDATCLTTKSVKRISIDSIELILLSKETEVVEASKENMVTDLIPGKYEGGFVLWECALDLAAYLVQLPASFWENIFTPQGSANKKYNVIELGCGLGIPLITLLTHFSTIFPLLNFNYTFSDFNIEVLRNVTWPHIQWNIPSLLWDSSIHCVAGDWITLSHSILQLQPEQLQQSSLQYGSQRVDDQMEEGVADEENRLFHIIISAETAYTVDHCEKVIIIIIIKIIRIII